MNDREIIERYLSGEESAFGDLVDVYLPRVFAFAFSLVRDRAVAEDLVQEVFLRAWKNIKGFDKNKSFKVWIFTITKNLAFDWFRKKKAFTFSALEHLEGEDFAQTLENETESLDDIFHKKEIASIVERELAKLPLAYQALMRLVYQDGFGLTEASEVLGEPYNTIKSKHRRAILLIKKSVDAPKNKLGSY